MPKLSREFKRRIRIAATALALALVVLFLPARFTTPLRTVFTEVVGPVEEMAYRGAGDALATGGTLTDMFLRTERDRALRKRVAELEHEVARVREELLVRERIISDMQALEVKAPRYRVCSAAVTSYDCSALRRSITIAAGGLDGVEEGMPVCASGALVGVVTETLLWRSRVRLITDPDSVIPVYAGPSRDLCTLVGRGTDKLSVEWVKRDAGLSRGALLLTAYVDYGAGKREPLPEGIPAAEVLEVKDDAVQLLFSEVAAIPRVNLNRLERVQVLIPTAATPGAE